MMEDRFWYDPEAADGNGAIISDVDSAYKSVPLSSLEVAKIWHEQLGEAIEEAEVDQ